MRRALVVPLLLAASSAYADDKKPEPLHPGDVGNSLFTPLTAEAPKQKEEPKPKPKPPTDEHTAAEVAKAPRPGQEGGRVDDGEHDSVLRNVGQGVLWLPKIVLQTLFAPIRGGIYVYEHYSLKDRYKRVAFDETNTYGVTPLLYVDSTYGATLGGRFVHRDLFGQKEHFALRAGFGGEFNQLINAQLRSGKLFGDRATLELYGEFEQRPHDPFYGIGNTGEDVVEVRHRQQLKRVTAALDVLTTGYFHVRTAGALTDLNYGVASDGPPIDVMYDTAMLTGWNGMRNLYGEVELRYDSRRVSGSLESKGVLLDAFTGRVHQLEDGNDYWRYGGEAIRFQPLGMGRTLATRLHVEAVSGSPTDVAFTQLPQLGGKSLLRGYAAERFRDRTALAASTEYIWDVSSYMLASIFVDAGRVYSGVRDISANDLRLGYGASLQLVDRRRFIAGVSIASSIDGGMFLNLVLDPVYEPEPRVRQK